VASGGADCAQERECGVAETKTHRMLGHGIEAGTQSRGYWFAPSLSARAPPAEVATESTNMVTWKNKGRWGNNADVRSVVARLCSEGRNWGPVRVLVGGDAVEFLMLIIIIRKL
jgi:hypothetical protein